MVEKEFTYDRVKSVLQQVVRENPGRIAEKYRIGDYTGCRYLDPEGEPSCVVGVTLDRLGIPRDEIGEMDTEANFLGQSVPQVVLGSDAPFWRAFDLGARRLLALTQGQQDSGDTWGEALEYALKILEG